MTTQQSEVAGGGAGWMLALWWFGLLAEHPRYGFIRTSEVVAEKSDFVIWCV